MVKREIVMVTEIRAPVEHVWQVLSDFTNYQAWNPLIRSVKGTLHSGARLVLRVKPPGIIPMTFRTTVIAVEPLQEIRWRGRLLVPGLFEGEHSLTLEPLAQDRVRFIQHEQLSGLLLPYVVALGALRTLERGFEQMGVALKTRAEATRTLV